MNRQEVLQVETINVQVEDLLSQLSQRTVSRSDQAEGRNGGKFKGKFTVLHGMGWDGMD